MTEPNGHVCPECAAPRTPDGTPSCACTRRASDALRDARTAEAAAAEDFDPLRIRPYVDLTANESAPATMRLRTVPPEALTAVQHVDSANSANQPPYPPPASFPEEPPRRRRRTALLAVTGAAVAVVAAAGFASGLFSYDAPARDRALPDDVRASVPDPSPTPTSAPPSPSSRSGSGSAPEGATSPTTTATTTTPSPSSSASPSPSASATATATRSQSPTPSPSSTPTPTAAASLAPGQGSTGDQPAQTLRRGDRGPEVTELQLRLRQLSLYTGKSDGTYSRQVEDAVRRYQWARGITGDKSGVYGAATRASLEGETQTP
ncbi:peptidoglycan-binding domain-containing protein [Streptomyces olivochromogenes]|uniref:Peptidoglycan-binding protein n=1 Tax=Streptomyces olivochromogenes TaxID=1963 RepID=A0A250V6M2_STROL|nr:peptidoglycan-binding domain-containing protein [Streptomyces olivochromogenes]KUN48364.1 hypothetical protein AQJ27_06205 [Streptomyces olivochromogenes]GAX49833.1 peptidoglycan-binding protein [Streptomyces olivochromogenes]